MSNVIHVTHQIGLLHVSNLWHICTVVRLYFLLFSYALYYTLTMNMSIFYTSVFLLDRLPLKPALTTFLPLVTSLLQM